MSISGLTDNAQTGRKAVKQAFMNQYDMILMDINLDPEMNGIHATGEIRVLENYRNIPIIALTGFSSLEEKEKIFNGGLDQLLTKPFTREELVTAVISAIR